MADLHIEQNGAKVIEQKRSQKVPFRPMPITSAPQMDSHLMPILIS